MTKTEKQTIQMFRRQWASSKHSYIALDLTDEQIAEKLFELREPTLEGMMDQLADYILANGLASEVQE